jgi:glycosyltransferase involved in cell wall biosynthesis
MRILAIERDFSACNYYRIRLPLCKLEEHEMAEVEFVYQDQELGSMETFEKLLWADMVIFHRPASPQWFGFIKKCQEHGKLIVCDYDDSPFETSVWNPYYKFIGVEECYYKWPDGREEWLWKNGHHEFNIDKNIERRDMFKACYRNADMVSTTTDILRNEFLEINKNTVVLPNLVDVDFYPQCELKKEQVRIGWQGGYSHYEDLYMIKPVLERITKEFNVKLVYLGDPKFAGIFKDIPKDKFEMQYWSDLNTYPYKLKCMNLDIGLCPLIENKFNRSKSAIKYFEYTMVDACTIASDIPPYSPVIKKDETGLLVKQNEWYEGLKALILDEKLRNRLAFNAKQDVIENYNIDKRIGEWNDAYTKLLKQEVSV